MLISIELSDDLMARVSRFSRQLDRSAQAIIREAIEQYIDREEVRERFRQEAVASQAEYQATGQHLSGDETLIWLRPWGSDAEAEASHGDD